MCILYDLVSSQAKKRFAPYQTFFSHGPSPSITQRRCSAVSSRHGTSSGMPRLRANFTRSSWHSRYDSVCQGRIAPPRSVFAASGTTSP